MNDNYLVLSRKWRPQSFDDVVGQLHVTQTLQNALNQNRLGHGYLFTGSRGVGKTSVARILSRAVNCTNPQDSNPCNKCNICIDILNGNNFDVIELDGASNRGIDEIRDLREAVRYAPSSGKYKIYIIDEVHMLTKEAFNALLKTLEEPPKHVLFILATTDPHKIPQTILSRTQRFNFKRISINEINDYLLKILNHEDRTFDEICLKLISRKADGSMRDALSLLDQVIAYCNDSIDVKNVSEAIGLIDNSIYSRVLFFILKSDLSKILSTINNSLSSGHSINDFTSGFIDFLNRSMHFYIKDNIEDDIFFDDEIKGFLKKIEKDIDINLIIGIIDSMLRFQNKLKFVSQPMISLESQFIKLAYLNKDTNSSINEDEIEKYLNKNNTIATTSKLESDGEKNKQVPDSLDDINDKSSNIKEDENNVVDDKFDSQGKGEKQLPNPSNSNGSSTSIKDNINDSENIKEDKELVSQKPDEIKIEDIQSKWRQIIEVIEKENPKTASFLSEAIISNLESKKITVSILNGSQFHINSLENDVNIINQSFSDILGQKINVYFQIKSDESIKKNKEDKPEQHPLLGKAIDLLDGEVI